MQLTGNLLENNRAPQPGDALFAVIGYAPREIVPGVVVRTNNSGDGELAAEYADIETAGGQVVHAPINCLFDHHPQRVQKQDAFGTFTVYQ